MAAQIPADVLPEKQVTIEEAAAAIRSLARRENSTVRSLFPAVQQLLEMVF
jgi:hypothetical protein